MKKYLLLIIYVFFSFLVFSHHTYANEDAYISCTVAPDGLNLRDNIDGVISNFLTCGNDLTIIEKNVGNTASCSNWYKVNYNNTTYYACGDYISVKETIDITNQEEYKTYLKELGFPDTYLDALTSLHVTHPNWQFKAFKTDISFNDIVKLEYDGHAQGWSLLEDTGSYFDGYKSIDSWSYDYLTNNFYNNFTGGGTYWFAASKNTIAYYMDPRNFLNDSGIFMFETLSYNPTYHTKEGIELMLKGSFMDGVYANTENAKTYADAFLDAGITYNISPYVLVSRVIQEIGIGGSTIVSGTVEGYEGYYNFYNINAYGNSDIETIANGLAHAKEQGWDNPYKAIIGGASFLGSNYVSQGQDTLYLQKWDLIAPSYATHQYMQNIQAPTTESVKTYRGYKNLDLIDSNFVFSIPVFSDLPESTDLGNSGNPNNYLSSLKINDTFLFETATHENNFNIELESTITSVEITAEKVSEKSTVSGTGSIALEGTKQVIPITVIAENGSSRTYTINITRIIVEEEVMPIEEIITKSEIKNDGTYFYGFEIDTDISSIVNKITPVYENSMVASFDKNNNEKNTGIIASGDRIKIKTSKEEKEYTLVIYGDVNSDGKISSADYIAIKNHIMETTSLIDSELKYADVNKDEKVTSADYIAIKNHIMEVSKIVQ